MSTAPPAPSAPLRSSGEGLELQHTQGEPDARYRSLLEAIPVQIWTARPDGQLDFVTEQTAAHFGLSAEKLLADGWLSVLHPDDVARTVERWTRSLATGEPYEVEFRLALADGSYAWHLGRAIAQRDEAGQILAWFGTNTNIEDQREQRRRTEALLAAVGEQARETAAQLLVLVAAKEAAERRVRELEAAIAAG